MTTATDLAHALTLGSALDLLRSRPGGYVLANHWQQGEFHHDVVLRITPTADLPGTCVVIATNCNGGVKEVLCFEEVPSWSALWHDRCPESAEFSGALPTALARVRTEHWFDPCALLADDARSELRAEHRERMPGGGWRRREGGACSATVGTRRREED